jgi:4-carboxymuconolactone decarboxylase
VPPFARDDEAAIYAFLSELHREHKVSDGTYAEAVERLGEAGVVDLVGLAGYYTLISMTINVFQVSPPAGAVNELGA